MSTAVAEARPVYIGWAHVSITPDKPVQLLGQFHERISRFVRDPVTATALAIETKNGAGQGDQLVMVSCDLAVITREIQEQVRAAIAGRAAGLDVRKVFLCCTHTHTAPPTMEGWYPERGSEIVGPVAYKAFLVERVAQVIVEAWNGRKPGALSRALGYAAVGFNRRVVYDDGTARMYGTSDTEHFMGEEGTQDHGVEMLFCWDAAGQISGVAVNVACPSQVVEGQYYVSADYWAAVRQNLKARYGGGFQVLAMCGSAGDQSPRDLVRRGRGEKDMRSDVGLEEMGARIAEAVVRAYPGAQAQMKRQVALEHRVKDVLLSGRKATQAEADEARALYAQINAKQPFEEARGDLLLRRRYKDLVERYETQGEQPTVSVELHAIRLGDLAICTNPFELYLDYGLRIKARSKALQTFVTQLACDWKGYLPTAKALAGGHYGAMVSDGTTGPEGGQELVNHSVALINSMWPA